MIDLREKLDFALCGVALLGVDLGYEGAEDRDHYTTAADLSTLSVAMIKNYPRLYKLYSEKQFTHNNIRQTSRNHLLFQDELVDGLAVAYTKKDGYMAVVSKKSDHGRFISVLIGAKDTKQRAATSSKLLAVAPLLQ